ncbi:Alpha-glucosidase 2 [Colletotrichum siamense]|nr:Alpha-glucosidase 2 [Colletotrichum siamense]
MSTPVDPLNFIPADVFYQNVPNFDKPNTVVNVESGSSGDTDLLRYAAHITLKDDGGSTSHCLVQFVTPLIWRIRYNPKFSDIGKYPDSNSRTIVMDSFRRLVDTLKDEYRESLAWNSPDVKSEWDWNTTFKQLSPVHWVLTSEEYASKGAQASQQTSLHFLASPFRIIATRKVTPMQKRPSFMDETIVAEALSSEEVIWQTNAQTFSYQGHSKIGAINNVVLNVHKPNPAEYLGFGEQGGRTVLKKPTYMNFFCYDNYNYKKVYGQGALDAKEPLYHSTPFYLEMNGTPKYQNVMGVMVDNYSQVAIDLGKNNSNSIGIATRFGTFDAYVMAADNVPKMIWQYTSIVGRPKLKPRFILGHHQGCYGYNHDTQVSGIVDGYINAGIPLDGMHLDVDFQDRYRTFTSNPKYFGVHFQSVKGFLGHLRSNGVKCCTNITPILTLRETQSDQYANLHKFWDENDKLNPATNLLVTDNRYLDGLPSNFPENGCTRYDVGVQSQQPVYLNPQNSKRPFYTDDSQVKNQTYQDQYQLIPGNYNSGYPFHGGVSYGTDLGTPGYYPDLNREVTREVWGQQYQQLFDDGLEFVWQDMTTPAVHEIYGDMLGFPSRLLISDDSYNQDAKIKPSTKTAIELWGLYSYNLHKATYHGLSKLKGRENKRNFIIGRGSLTGMHRYAGLWTGDNGSSWDFWKISVAQVLALGYSGLTIAGVDMGGFTVDPAHVQDKGARWCDPELLIRWYSGAFLLPWYRNHYNQRDKEPYIYTYANDNYGIQNYGGSVQTLYQSVSPICRYFVQLRYTLLQVLYDAMFANLIHGLPIARAMLITDPEDTTLFNANDDFIDTQYLLGHNILVCPVLDPGVVNRDVYLPGADLWFPSNLRVQPSTDPSNLRVQGGDSDPLQIKHAARLGLPVAGGTTVSYTCYIPDGINRADQIPYVTPVYVRGGAIIPQIDVRQSIEENDYNPPTIHVYPGAKKSDYTMYLDNGTTRDSAPNYVPQYMYRHHANHDSENGEAQNKFREVKIEQEYQDDKVTRTVSLSHPWNNYDASQTVGTSYQLAIWTVYDDTLTDPSKVNVNVTFKDAQGHDISNSGLTAKYDPNRAVLIVNVPVDVVPQWTRSQAGAHPTSTPRMSINITGLN